ncbi:uncharacterized protein PV09_05861 [Verruconis gallopava]|uniref:AAA+ ATPase domain-containing protein n=1 Tax=Verruconis gallopava TaxID=253628 RepID=A0A0D2A879_9PEZI|nr:uncharacterized protein PV09_05861 [Verruconis gallopava]KIW02800.1 hypothetical protein PV09_05861 [Verruconis gallopava]
MLSRKPINYMQKTYDDCYLVCSTAVYFETQNNEAEALRSWKNALEQIRYHNAYRLPAGYTPKSETERALMESLRQMEEQCKERVDLLEALKRSREEVEDKDKKESSVRSLPWHNGGDPVTISKVDGWLGGGTVPPSSYDAISRPPPLPNRPSLPSRHASQEGRAVAQRTTSLTSPLPEPELPSLTPFASNSRISSKSSRTPSPDKKERSLLRTLRPDGEPKKKNLPIRQKAPVPAAKAAAQAWVPNRPASSSSLVVQSSDNAAKAASRTSLSPSNAANTKLPRDRDRLRKSEPVQLPYRKEYAQACQTPINTEDAIATARKRHGRRSSPPEAEHASANDYSENSPARSNVELSSALSREEGARVRRKPIARRQEEEPVILGEESSSSPTSKGHRSSDDDHLVSPDERLWKEKVNRIMKRLPKGVDEASAKAILNDIVVHGDEVHWDDIAGLDVAKNALKETVVYPFLRPDLFMGLREPARGMLLFGPPGTGKTMLARAVATESKSTFFAISASSLTSKFLGESEKLVRALFALAKALAPSIIFVDEIDSLLSSRGDNGEHEATRRIKTEFLIQWSDLARAAAGREQSDRDKERGDASRVLVLAATNMPWAIDEAARRRFVRRQYIPLPEDHVRKMQIETLLGHQKHDLTPREIDQLVRLTVGFSGSDITALAKDAAMGPLRSLGEALLSMSMDDIRPIQMQDFINSLKSIRPSVSRQGLKQFEDWAREYGERGG